MTSYKGDLNLVRKINKGLVLNMVKKHVTISRVEISRNSRLSRTAVSDIVSELLNERLIREEGLLDFSKVGRRPSMLRFNPEAYYIATGDFGETYAVTLGIVNLTGEVKERLEVTVDTKEDKETIFDNFVENIYKMLDKLSLDKDKILGIGVAFPGEFNHEDGVSIFSPNYHWRNVPVRDLIEKKSGIKTFVDNDARLKALGEYLYGGGRGANNLVYIGISNGIGSGIILNGNLYRGSHYASGEIGHCQIASDGPKCGCGHHGCLGSVASGRAILYQVRTAIKEGKKTIISDYAGSEGDGLTIDHIFQAAEEKDEFASQVVKNVGSYIGMALAYVMNTFDPDVVLLGGYVIEKGGKRLLEIIKGVAAEKVFDISSYRTTRIEQAVLGGNSGIIGASAFVSHEVFKSPLVFK